MAKDPAFLFYPGDFNTGTQFFNNEQVGKYMRLLMAQHQHGHLTQEQMLFICVTHDPLVWSKFEVDEEGKMFNRRLDDEKSRRQAFSESRKSNRNKSNNESLHIYFILNPHTKLVKIGSSVDVDRRLTELKRQYNNDLKVLFISEKYPQTKEKELHLKFKNKNVVNEWFDLDESDISHIKSHINIHMIDHMAVHMETKNENENSINNKKESFSKLDLFEELLTDEIYVSNLQQTHRGKDLKQAFEECYTHHSNAPNPPVELWQWKQKLNTWLSIKRHDRTNGKGKAGITAEGTRERLNRYTD